jgi:hypothetical protein
MLSPAPSSMPDRAAALTHHPFHTSHLGPQERPARPAPSAAVRVSPAQQAFLAALRHPSGHPSAAVRSRS